MLRAITMEKVATFGTKPQVLGELARVNYVYGANGSGKTLISQKVADDMKYPTCSIEWVSAPLQTLVYNKDFVDEILHQDSEIKGIFTLSKESHEILQQIKVHKRELDTTNTEKNSLVTHKDTKEEELTQQETDFEERCWLLKQKHDEDFKQAFTGYRADKSKFKDKVLEEVGKQSPLRTLEELRSKADSVFQKELGSVATISVLSYDKLLQAESDPILAKRIIGKQDVDIAAMIKKLGNHDWVSQGLVFFNENSDICPFCQRRTEETFRIQLEDYFDTTYTSDVKAIKDVESDYAEHTKTVMASIDALLSLKSEFVDNAEIKRQKELIEGRIRNSTSSIANKVKEPSTAVKVESLKGNLEEINKCIEDANTRITENNRLAQNIVPERASLISQVWRLIIEENRHDYAAYSEKKTNLRKAIKGISESITKKQELINELTGHIVALEKQTNSIKPSVNAINNILASFGFTNFRIEEVDTKGLYKLVRDNGEDAKATLSEGEKTFITFLYFYQLLHGSEEQSGVTTDRVVVFDDPISSLDSTILFIVSSLIKKVVQEAKEGSGAIKQVIILTHNVYFHKEVSFNSRRPAASKFNDETFWVLRKQDGKSVLQEFQRNPISTSYELLWQEIRRNTTNGATEHVAIQNTLRRILENYFKILGNLSFEDVVDKFDGEDKVVCNSLISWIQGGSHLVSDDLYVVNSIEMSEKYLKVFKDIFIKTDHEAHYNMMMQDTV